MDTQSWIVGAGLFLAGYVLGRLTAPKASGSVAQTPFPPQAGHAVRTPAAGGPVDAEVEAHLRSGHKIMAIKRYRELYGVGLKEAKDAVEALEARMPR